MASSKAIFARFPVQLQNILLWRFCHHRIRCSAPLRPGGAPADLEETVEEREGKETRILCIIDRPSGLPFINHSFLIFHSIQTSSIQQHHKQA